MALLICQLPTTVNSVERRSERSCCPQPERLWWAAEPEQALDTPGAAEAAYGALGPDDAIGVEEVAAQAEQACAAPLTLHSRARALPGQSSGCYLDAS